MKDGQNNRRLPLAWIGGVAIAVLAAGGGVAWWAYNNLSTSVTRTPTVTPTPAETPVPQPTQSPVPPTASQQETVNVYWLQLTETSTEVLPTPITVEKSDDKGQILKLAFQHLLSKTPDSASTTAIPQETKLLALAVKDDGVHVDLSQEFTSGGGSASMTGRLAQVVYTATTLNPNASVWIDVEGQPLELLGEGEGLMVEQPMTRNLLNESYQMSP